MKTYTIVIPSGETFELAARGNYVRVKSAPVDCVIVNPDAQGDERVEASQGDDFEFSTFERLSISHSAGTSQTFKILIAIDRKSNSTPVSASTQITSLPAVTIGALPATAISMGMVQISISNTAVQISAPNSTRRYMLLQNNDSSAVLRVAFGGVAASPTNGFRVMPGGTFEMSNYVPNTAITACMETASAQANNVCWMAGG